MNRIAWRFHDTNICHSMCKLAGNLLSLCKFATKQIGIKLMFLTKCFLKMPIYVLLYFIFIAIQMQKMAKINKKIPTFPISIVITV